MTESAIAVLAASLRAGDVVFRWLRSGDMVTVNRQPTLHRLSFMAHEVVVMPWSTIRLPTLITTPYNADFDGVRLPAQCPWARLPNPLSQDELNIGAPQTLQACHEARHLMHVAENLISPNAHPTAGCIQNSMLGLYLFSADDVFLSRAEAYQMAMEVSGVELPLPAILCSKRGPRWTGKQLLSMCLPRTCNKERGHPDQADYSRIQHGQVIMGRMGRADFGRGAGNLWHRILLTHGGYEGAEVLKRIVDMVDAWLVVRGFTIGMRDCNGAIAPPPFPALGTQEAHIVEQLRDYRGDCLKTVETAMAKQPRNAFLDMFSSGSKGKVLNTVQVKSSVGPQDIKGARTPLFLGTRTICYYKPGETHPEARGYVTQSYTQGLPPPAFFFHQMLVVRKPSRRLTSSAGPPASASLNRR